MPLRNAPYDPPLDDYGSRFGAIVKALDSSTSPFGTTVSALSRMSISFGLAGAKDKPAAVLHLVNADGTVLEAYPRASNTSRPLYLDLDYFGEPTVVSKGAAIGGPSGRPGWFSKLFAQRLLPYVFGAQSYLTSDDWTLEWRSEQPDYWQLRGAGTFNSHITPYWFRFSPSPFGSGSADVSVGVPASDEGHLQPMVIDSAKRVSLPFEDLPAGFLLDKHAVLDTTEQVMLSAYQMDATRASDRATLSVVTYVHYSPNAASSHVDRYASDLTSPPTAIRFRRLSGSSIGDESVVMVSDPSAGPNPSTATVIVTRSGNVVVIASMIQLGVSSAESAVKEIAAKALARVPALRLSLRDSNR